MFYVYILNSISYPNQKYIGYTDNIKTRLHRHNSGYSSYTSQFMPWKIISLICFEDKYKALEFEKYLKSNAGKAFLEKRLIGVGNFE